MKTMHTGYKRKWAKIVLLANILKYYFISYFWFSWLYKGTFHDRSVMDNLEKVFKKMWWKKNFFYDRKYYKDQELRGDKKRKEEEEETLGDKEVKWNAEHYVKPQWINLCKLIREEYWAENDDFANQYSLTFRRRLILYDSLEWVEPTLLRFWGGSHEDELWEWLDEEIVFFDLSENEWTFPPNLEDEIFASDDVHKDDKPSEWSWEYYDILMEHHRMSRRRRKKTLWNRNNTKSNKK